MTNNTLTEEQKAAREKAHTPEAFNLNTPVFNTLPQSTARFLSKMVDADLTRTEMEKAQYAYNQLCAEVVTYQAKHQLYLQRSIRKGLEALADTGDIQTLQDLAMFSVSLASQRLMVEFLGKSNEDTATVEKIPAQVSIRLSLLQATVDQGFRLVADALKAMASTLESVEGDSNAQQKP